MNALGALLKVFFIINTPFDLCIWMITKVSDNKTNGKPEILVGIGFERRDRILLPELSFPLLSSILEDQEQL